MALQTQPGSYGGIQRQANGGPATLQYDPTFNPQQPGAQGRTASGLSSLTPAATPPSSPGLGAAAGAAAGGQFGAFKGTPPTAPAPPMPGGNAGTSVPSSAAPGEGYGPGFGETYGMSHVGQYDQPTDFETFAKQQMQGDNPYYQRLQQQGDAAINQQMAARGHYNSGGALSALGNYNGALGAAQFQDMANMLQGAGNQGLQREGQGQNVANSVQSQQQGRIQNQFSDLSDIAHLGAGTVGGFYGQGGNLSGDAAMAGINAGVNSAQLMGQGQNVLPNAAMSAFNAYLAHQR